MTRAGDGLLRFGFAVRAVVVGLLLTLLIGTIPTSAATQATGASAAIVRMPGHPTTTAAAARSPVVALSATSQSPAFTPSDDESGPRSRDSTAFVAAEGGADAAKITFGHGARHLAGTGLDEAAVNAAIKAQVEQSIATASATGSFWGRVAVDGQIIEYRAYTLKDGTINVINVGTYYVPK